MHNDVRRDRTPTKQASGYDQGLIGLGVAAVRRSGKKLTCREKTNLQYEYSSLVTYTLLWILCDTLARWLEALSSTLVEMVTHARKLPGRQVVLPCCGEYVVDIGHWRLGGQHTQINRRVCRSSGDGCFPEMTRRTTMP